MIPYSSFFLFLVYLASYFDPAVFFFHLGGPVRLFCLFLGGDFRLFVFERNTDRGGEISTSSIFYLILFLLV